MTKPVGHQSKGGVQVSLFFVGARPRAGISGHTASHISVAHDATFPLICNRMRLFTKTDQELLLHPWDFARKVLQGFSRNQGLILAGAVAYYALLSLLPLIILSVVALSHWVDQAELLATLGRYLERLVPSQSKAVLADVSDFIDNPAQIGAILLITMLFFSSLTFSILEKALTQIFGLRHVHKKRHAMVSALLPYSLVILIGFSLLGITIASIVIHSVAQESIHLLGHDLPLSGFSGVAFYALGLTTEIGILSVFYIALPAGRTRLRHALIGATTIAIIWEGVRHVLVWYFTSLSAASVVYGSLTTSVVVLFSIEIAATLLLLGAQVIAEYEQLEIKLEN